MYARERAHVGVHTLSQCAVSVCAEHHPVEYAIDGTNRWWQSPSIKNGMEYHYVTITLDLKQVCAHKHTHTSFFMKACINIHQLPLLKYSSVQIISQPLLTNKVELNPA